MKTFTDEEMGQPLPTAKSYGVAILKRGPKFDDPATPGRRQLRSRRNRREREKVREHAALTISAMRRS